MFDDVPWQPDPDPEDQPWWKTNPELLKRLAAQAYYPDQPD